MTRGLVSPTYAATTSPAVARAGSGCSTAEADWPTYVTGFLGWDASDAARSLSPRVSRLDDEAAPPIALSKGSP